MTLPSSGALSMSAINAEFGRGNNLNAYRGTAWYTDAGGSGTFSSGALSFSDFYGKRLTSPTFSFTISSNQTNANLASLATAAGWNGSSKLVATISSGVYISSNSTGTPALTVSGSFPGGVELTNNGYIVGMGGNGGDGSGVAAGSAAFIAGSNGASGGAALSVSASITITNSGTIAGGGGGGGGGRGGKAAHSGGDDTYWSSAGGGGGGGGRSSNAANTAGGAGGYAGYAVGLGLARSGSGGGGGTVSANGGGGAGGNAGYVQGGAGGAGGGWGASGSTGGTGGSQYTYYPGPGPYSGGSAGNAVTGNSYISWSATGTRLGGIS